MKILGIDTTTKFLCLGICHNDRVYEYNLEAGRKLSGLIAVAIERAVDALGWRINDIDYFAVGLGPGSFTGIRVGVATIKGLAFSLDKPVIGVPTLDILAMNSGRQGGYAVPVVDARRGLIYSSVYRNNNGKYTRVKPHMLVSLDEFSRRTKAVKNAVVLGDALGLYKNKILSGMHNAVILDKDYWYPAGRNIISLAKEMIDKKKISSALALKPIYLYPKECQVKNPGTL